MNCIHCGSLQLMKRGTRRGKERFQCGNCKKYSSFRIDQKPKHRYRSARILLLDIETSLMKFYGFSPKMEYIPPEMMITDWSVICWGAKWLFEPEIMGQVVSPEESMKRTDASVMGEIWNLVNQADIIVTQNGIQFDMKKLNSRFKLNGYNPPSKYMNVDTLKVSKEVFGWSYNRLDEVGQKLGIGKKSNMGIEDWIRCSEGSQEHLIKMLEYCKRDVAPLLEDVYLHYLPWIPNHPNLNIYTEHDADVCRNCESQNLKWGEKYPTPQGMWEGWRCNDCGAIGRGKRKEHRIKVVSIV